jgi:hypothetical protein
MAQFIKHVGKIGDRKVAIVFRQIPGEEHMALVVYTELLNQNIHDPLVATIESDIGQQAEELADALSRSLLPDGRVILNTLHEERMIKKVRTSDVIMIPRTDASIRLDELNKMLNEMKLGANAVKKMAEADATRGLVDAPTKRAAEAKFKAGRQPAQAPAQGALSDRDLASDMLTQAQRMEVEAKSMIAEASRMKKEAEKMFPGVVTKETTTVTDKDSSKRGRPAKAKTVVADATQ